MGFEPFSGGNSKLLILGSFPSVKSRSDGFYYGNPQNRFWRILAEFNGCPAPHTIEQKKKLLCDCKIALWDVVISCEIVGSMDKDIRDPVIARVDEFVARHNIRRIITNGKTAYDLLIKHFPDLRELCTPLPSTSPANARLNKSVWLNALADILSDE